MFGLRYRFADWKYRLLQKAGRFNKGWDKRDAWNLNSTLLNNLGEAMVYLSQHGMSYPASKTFEQWHEELYKHGSALASGESEIDWTDKEIQAKTEALRWVADNWLNLWD